ncbi:olfactory receptor 56A5-like [Lissotriton helveticus]
MAHDRYVAICKPFQYPIIINNQYLLKAVLFAFVKGFVLCMPEPILIAQLNYCADNVLYHCFCDLSIASLACDHNPVIDLYVVVSTWFSIGFDISFIFFSYTMIIHTVLKLRSSTEMSKAFGTCASHLILISYYYSSLIVLVIANAMGKVIPTDVHTLMAILYSLIPPVINPLVYGLRSKEIKEKVVWIFHKL